MLYKSNKSTRQLTALLFGGMFSLSCAAFMSADVIKAMDQANFCKRANQTLVFVECMRRNNEFIRASIKKNTQTAIAKFNPYKRKKLEQGVTQSIHEKIDTCMKEQTRFSGNSGNDRRQEYCLYENMLEVLINIDKNIEIYAR